MRLCALVGIALATFIVSGLDGTARSQEFSAISGGAAAPRSAFTAFGMRGGGFRGGGFRGHGFRGHGFFGGGFKGRGFAGGRFFGRDRFGFFGRDRFGFFGRDRFGGWGGGYLNDSYAPFGLNFQQYIVTGGSASPYYAPSVTQLPQSAGIRESRPAQAVLYVINGRSASQRGAIVSAPKSSRAKEAAGEEVAFGARIVHLEVPVARRVARR